MNDSFHTTIPCIHRQNHFPGLIIDCLWFEFIPCLDISVGLFTKQQNNFFLKDLKANQAEY